jgi:hypothetical protein
MMLAGSTWCSLDSGAAEGAVMNQISLPFKFAAENRFEEGKSEEETGLKFGGSS